MEVAIASQVTKQYKKVLALDTVTFKIHEGESVGLVGPNGAGKTTLLRMLCGAIRPTSGEVLTCAINAGRGESPGRMMGFVLEPPGIPSSLSVREALRLEAYSQKMPVTAIRNALKKFGIERYSNRHFGKLSMGQKQRVSLALAAFSEPRLLILDEPTNGLDIESIHWLRGVIQDRESKGLATIISSHNLPELDKVVSRMLVLNKYLLHDGDCLESEKDYFELVGQGTLRGSDG